MRAALIDDMRHTTAADAKGNQKMANAKGSFFTAMFNTSCVTHPP